MKARAWVVSALALLFLNLAALSAGGAALAQSAPKLSQGDTLDVSQLSCRKLDAFVRASDIGHLAAIQIWFYGMTSGTHAGMKAMRGGLPPELPFRLTNGFARKTIEHLAYRCGTDMNQPLVKAYMTFSKDETAGLSDEGIGDQTPYLKGTFDFDPSTLSCGAWIALNDNHNEVSQMLELYWLSGLGRGYDIVADKKDEGRDQFSDQFATGARDILNEKCTAAQNEPVWRTFLIGRGL